VIAFYDAAEYLYGSYLVTPSLLQYDSDPPIATDAVKWAHGRFLETAGSTNHGKLIFKPGIELDVEFEFNVVDGLTAFSATGKGLIGPTTGAVYRLSGWVTTYDAQPSKVQYIRGSVVALRGPDSRPKMELGGQEIGTVGYFDLHLL